ncbi:flagellinolysin [Ferrimonas futtsuensis]|uniref:flagellinolysin n=1 Tax=Ferrimonas futtsuensis TaxID=364764 RepID=UPI000483A236|nr:flagellinolysin [Ferrimonas futtsuensis]
MRIATNTTSMFTSQLLQRSSSGVAASMERMSSGLRINSAKDDAAGLQITNRLTSQINGLNVAIKNASDAISMAQTAEGAVQEVTESLFRIRDLSLQAANGSNSDEDRQALQKEAAALLEEIDRTNTTTSFGGNRLFKETDASRVDPIEREIVSKLANSWLKESEELIKDKLGIDGKNTTLKIDLEHMDGPGGTAASVSSLVAGSTAYNQVMTIDLDDFGAGAGGGSLELDETILHEMVHAIQGANFDQWGSTATWFKEGSAEVMRGADDRLSADIANHGGGATGIGAIWTQLKADVASTANPTTGIGTAAAYSGGYVVNRYIDHELGGGGLKAVNTAMAGGATLDAALNTASGGRWGNVNALFAELDGAGGGGAATKFEEFINTQMDLTNADNGSLAGFDVTGAGPELDNVMQGVTGDGSGAASFDEYFVSGDDDNDGGDFDPGSYDPSAIGATEVALADYAPEIGEGEGGYQIAAQVGANANEEITFNLGSFGTKYLGLDRIDLTKDPQSAIEAVDDALKIVDSSRASLGATVNRLEHTIANLTNITENTSASRSRIRDTDMAKESSYLAKQQVLQQSASAMLAQANQLPSAALSLL